MSGNRHCAREPYATARRMSALGSVAPLSTVKGHSSSATVEGITPIRRMPSRGRNYSEILRGQTGFFEISWSCDYAVGSSGHAGRSRVSPMITGTKRILAPACCRRRIHRWSSPRPGSAGTAKGTLRAIRAKWSRHSCWLTGFRCERKGVALCLTGAALLEARRMPRQT
jgi:hypothetical protein